MAKQEQIEEEHQRLLKKYLHFSDEYRTKICSKCIGTKQQTERSCAKLNGFKNLSCEHMRRALNRRLRPNSDILLHMALNNAMEVFKRD